MKRFRLTALVVFVVLVGMLTFPHFQNREPSYQGRTLTQWPGNAESFRGSISDRQQLWSATTNAVKQIGTNAIPFLLKKLTAKDTAFEKRLKSLLQKQSLIQFQLKNPWYVQRLIVSGFEILGKDAQPATTKLIMLTKDPDQLTRFFALQCLCAIKPDKDTLMPILVHSLHDQAYPVKLMSAKLLIDHFPEEADKAGAYNVWPNALNWSTNTVPTNAPVID